MQDGVQTQGPLRPLDPLAELMLLDTRPRYPMGFFVECGCEGPLDRERLRRALNAVAARHPNAQSHIVWKTGRPFWKSTTCGPKLFWDPVAEGTHPWRPFDLVTESGLRLIVFPEHHRTATVWTIVLFGHHAVCDGLAACELLGEIWTHYADNPLPPLATLEDAPTDSVSEKENQSVGSEKEKPIAQRLSAVFAEALRFLIFSPTALGRLDVPALPRTPLELENANSSVRSSELPPYRLCVFTEDQIRTLRSIADKRSVTLNALILAASIRVFAAWNKEATGAKGGIRVTMPVSLRQDELRRPAENRIGYAFLDRKFTDCQNREELIRTLAEASVWIKESGAAGMFITALGILRKIPGLLWLILRLPVCFSTAVVSNLGDATRSMRVSLPSSQKGHVAGDVVITRVVGVPPVRPRTAASMGIARYGDRLWLSCLADERVLGPSAAKRLLAAIHTECLESAGKT